MITTLQDPRTVEVNLVRRTTAPGNNNRRKVIVITDICTSLTCIDGMIVFNVKRHMTNTQALLELEQLIEMRGHIM